MRNYYSQADLNDRRESERARGAEPIDQRTAQRDRVEAIDEDPAPARQLPDFHYTDPAELAPIIHPEAPESRMSTAQLRDRIETMESTTRMKAEDDHRWPKGKGAPIGYRPEKPGARIARAEKLARYKAELTRKEARDAQAEAERQRYNARIDAADAARAEREAAAAIEQPAATIQATAAAAAPALVQCRRCGMMVAQDAEGDMLPHIAIGHLQCPAERHEWTAHAKRDLTTQAATIPDPPPNSITFSGAAAIERGRQAHAAAVEPDKCCAAGCSSEATADRGYCGFHAAQADAADRAAKLAAERQAEPDLEAAGGRIERDTKPVHVDPATAADHAARLAIECPQCHAAPGERCKNYKGDHCHHHGVRKPERTPAARAARHAIKEATANRRAVVTEIRDQTKQAQAKPPKPAPSDDLVEAMEAILTRHGFSSCIDAIWTVDKAMKAKGRPSPA